MTHAVTRATAPGKIILFGEHAVVYGQPALAVPVNQVYAETEVLDVDRAGIWVNAPDIRLHAEHSRLALDDALAAVIDHVLAKTPTFDRDHRGIEIKISSTIPLASGLGSGAAVSVAIIRALSVHLGQPFMDEQINEIAYEVEKIHHGTPSGIDNTVVTYAKPIFFIKEQPIELLNVAKPFTIIIGDTGIPAPTKESVGDVRKLWEQDKRKIETLFAAIGSIARTARQAIEGGHPEWLGPLMNENQRILAEMGVSSLELDRLVEASLSAGASGAKLSGGGRGGNMIALSPKENGKRVVDALYEAGARNVIVTEIT